METNQLVIRSPISSSSSNDDDHQHMYKKFRHDPWSLNYLCGESSSPLATLPLESVFQYETFRQLSPQDHAELAKLLPVPLDPSFFSKEDNPIFWAALSDWQTMLAQGNLIDNPDNTFQVFRETSSTTATAASNVNNPILQYKEEGFESYWGELNDRDKLHNVAGDSKNITLKDMCRKGLIREQDVIVYKRNFSACKVVVSKSMRVVKADGATGISIELDKEIFEDFETPTALETKILDRHGKVSKDKRPNGNAFKSIRLIRDGKDLGRLFDIRKDGFGDSA
ncbi:hypothetical protein BX666DRAFT_2020762 [Dichotomocladium elegans]|nr:hypothetical protein BX666DRAFT_2020762 [Dichotomocladium elegans]